MQSDSEVCDIQSKRIENLENALYNLLIFLGQNDSSEKMEQIIDTYIHNCNLFSKRETRLKNKQI
jgi:hypothetical protein